MEITQQNPSTNENEVGAILDNVKRLNVGSGKLVVNNDGLVVGGTVIIDSAGLNSLNNFRSSHVTDIATFETSSTSYVDVTGGSLDTLTLDRNAQVLFIINVIGRNNSINDNEASVGFSAKARIYDVENDLTKAYVTFKGSLGFYYTFSGGGDSWASSVTSTSYSKVIISSVSAGTHNFKLQLQAVDGGTARLFDADIGYVVLGI